MVLSTSYRYADHRVVAHALPAELSHKATIEVTRGLLRWVHVGPALVLMDGPGRQVVEVQAAGSLADWPTHPVRLEFEGRGWDGDVCLVSDTEALRFRPGAPPVGLGPASEHVVGAHLLDDAVLLREDHGGGLRLVCRNLDGTVRWTRDTSAYDVLVDDHGVLVGELGGGLVDLDPASGAVRWEVRLEGESDALHKLIGRVDDTLWVQVQWPQALIGLARTTGALVSRVDHPSFGGGSDLDASGRLHIFSGTPHLRVDLRAGAVDVDVPQVQGPTVLPQTRLALADGRLIVVHTSFVSVLRPEAPDVLAPLWSADDPIQDVAVAHDQLYVLTDAGELTVLG